MNKPNNIFAEVLNDVRPSSETLEKINRIAKDFVGELVLKLKKRRIKADVFVGGSLAKDTLVKKDKYDIDIFVRFGNVKGDISDVLGKFVDGKRVHGSRDYFQIFIEDILIEIIPVKKIKKPSEAENITDLSFFHVEYLLGKLKKNPKLGDEIRLAKVFCYAQNAYGAESYIHGFSGYALELLICHYGSFLKFCKSAEEIAKNGGIVIDSEKLYKNNKEVFEKMNKSKLSSPIILIDPTFKERNALAGLSMETFLEFKENCKKFLKNPSKEFFVRKNISEKFEKVKEVKTLIVKTSKQGGDIAGTKLRKFFDFFLRQASKEFEIRKKGFDYNEDKNLAKYYIVISKKKDELRKGPQVNNCAHFDKFRKQHPDSIVRGKYVYIKLQHNLSFEEWLKVFLKKDKKIVEEMSISGVKLS
ncbi:hypothetical protein HOD75_02120 [archaeon]|jgi:tRNA nucleotidyltransferase (CCA-adding enzyme)|nr:hypothetical protein [archaeon]MBT4241673.1 hypothetical protein [archaeon]MBT4418068.1 hypothetical protein [archaeon]